MHSKEDRIKIAIRYYTRSGNTKTLARAIEDAVGVKAESVAAQEHMLDAYPSLRAQYAPGDGNTEVYYLKDATAVICSFTEAPMTIRF